MNERERKEERGRSNTDIVAVDDDYDDYAIAIDDYGYDDDKLRGTCLSDITRIPAERRDRRA